MLRLIAATLLTVALSAASVRAELLFYQFDGEIGVSNYTGVAASDPVQYIFAVNRSLQAIKRNVSAVSELSDEFWGGIDWDDNPYMTEIDYFFAEITSSLVLPDIDLSDNLFWQSIGNNTTTTYTDTEESDYFSSLLSGQKNHYIEIYSYETPFDRWVIGDQFIGNENSRASKQNPLSVQSKLVLTRIYSSQVPEPGTISLLGIGILALCAAGAAGRRGK